MNILGIDLGSTQTCAILAQKDGEGLKILGFGKCATRGVRKGAITNIDQASNSIEQAVSEAQMMSGVNYDKVIVSMSGAYTKSVHSTGIANVAAGSEIGIGEIVRAVNTAKHNANVPQDHEIMHVLPFNFKVNDLEHVDDPLGMSGSRLEVSTHVVFAQKAHIKNLKKAFEIADLRVDNLVLSGYASAISCLDPSEKELGAVLIDMGGAICDIVVYMGNSIRSNDCLQIGSSNITNDLSTALHTPLKEAEKIKLNYANLSLQRDNLVRVPSMGDEEKIMEIQIDTISNVIYARAQETLMILAKMLSDNPYANAAGAGVVLTGGMTKLARLDELASAMFDNKSVRLASARKDWALGYNEIFSDPENSCAIGLCLYGAGYFTPYELDSSNKLRYKGEEEPKPQPFKHEVEFEERKIEISSKNAQENDTITLSEHIDFRPADEGKGNIISRLWQQVVNRF